MNFEESLKKLDLAGIILIIGILSQRALELMAAKSEDSKLVVPDKKIIT